MREITQVHYADWPDFGAPASPSQLLGLVELTNVAARAASPATQASNHADDPDNAKNSRPMLVHCSAGCGRTGTFCTIDSVIDMLKRQRKEARSGVTPMEMTASDGGDYMHKGMDDGLSTHDSGDGYTASGIADGWVFDQDTDLVQKTVEAFRGQRLSMVQSLRQYVLCYETVLQWIAAQCFTPDSGQRSV